VAPVITEPVHVPVVAAEPPVTLQSPEPTPAAPEPITQPTPEPELPMDPIALQLAERNGKIDAAANDALTFLDMLGTEVFELEPVSKYFDDWMVNLRQTILSFESNEAIGADETFNASYNQIFGKIQEELDNRIAMEGDMAVSLRTLVENRYLLNKIEQEQKEETKKFVEKGASNIETLMHSMANIEKELAEAQAVKVSIMHPMQKMAKDQKVAELTQKLNSVKKRLAMAVGSSSTGDGKSGDLDAQFEVQAKMLEEKRKIAIAMLNKNVDDIFNEIAKLKMTKTSNPIKKVTIQQNIAELETKMVEAKKSVTMAEQNSSNELKKLKEEFEKKKQAALGNVQTLEKDIAKKAVDNSAGVRKQAADELVAAVKALAAKKQAVPLEQPKT
jgi:nitrogen regulatory protein PII